MTTDNFCFYLQNRLIQTSKTGGQWYSNTSPFSIPWLKYSNVTASQLKPPSCAINGFTAVINTVHMAARLLVIVSHFHPGLIYASKATLRVELWNCDGG